jgi:hypothetical protein
VPIRIGIIHIHDARRVEGESFEGGPLLRHAVPRGSVAGGA